jgi:hypothetical protein
VALGRNDGPAGSSPGFPPCLGHSLEPPDFFNRSQGVWVVRAEDADSVRQQLSEQPQSFRQIADPGG